MKTFTASLFAVLLMVSSCSSPEERHEQRQAEAKEQYDQSLKQSQEQLQEDELKARRSQAKDMVDDSDYVEVDKDKGKIKVKD
jgi:ElaB/YqjD/DUF883 family membrane-anchored ribosome-binding protein